MQLFIAVVLFRLLATACVSLDLEEGGATDVLKATGTIPLVSRVLVIKRAALTMLPANLTVFAR